MFVLTKEDLFKNEYINFIFQITYRKYQSQNKRNHFIKDARNDCEISHVFL